MMNKNETPLINFLNEMMRRRKRLPSQMASELGISHATVSRWLSGKDVPRALVHAEDLPSTAGYPLTRFLLLSVICLKGRSRHLRNGLNSASTLNVNIPPSLMKTLSQ